MVQIQVWYGKYRDSPVPSYKFLSCIYEKYKIISHILGDKENFNKFQRICYDKDHDLCPQDTKNKTAKNYI